MAARTNEAYRAAHVGLRPPAPARRAPTPWDPPLQLANGDPATIGDLFTSERAVAILLRWHVNQPPDLLPLGANSKLVIAYQNARTANPAGLR